MIHIIVLLFRKNLPKRTFAGYNQRITVKEKKSTHKMRIKKYKEKYRTFAVFQNR